VHYLEERELGNAGDSPFSCDDYVSFTWTTVFAGVVASECLLLGKAREQWSVIGYRIDGISEYVQLDGVGRLSLHDPDERGALSEPVRAGEGKRSEEARRSTSSIAEARNGVPAND
jgi:hypothetical protein